MATVPAHGGSMMDGTSDPHWTPAYCGYYVPASKCMKKEKPATTPKRRHWDQESEW
jgi:hypothetical protein